MNNYPLVTIAIPAFNPRFFQAALQSTLTQSWPAIEVVVCDDCPGEEIGRIVDEASVPANVQVRYLRNDASLGFVANVQRCVAEARGEYVKVLCDDDRLTADCIAMQVAPMLLRHEVGFVAAQRLIIDANGTFLPAHYDSCSFLEQDSYFKGTDLLGFLQTSPFNFIGGFSTVLFRRSELEHALQRLTLLDSLGGAMLDLALYVDILQRSNIAYLNRVMSFQRLHAERLSLRPDMRAQEPLELNAIIARLPEHATVPAAGWVRYHPLSRLTADSEIEQGWSELPLNRIFHIQQTILAEMVGTSCDSFEQMYRQWLGVRRLTAAQKRLLPERIEGWSQRPAMVALILNPQGDPALLARTLESVNAQSYPAEAIVVLSRGCASSRLEGRAVVLPLETEPFSQINRVMDQLDTSDWLMLLWAGDRLVPDALLLLAEYAVEHEAVQVCYADEGGLHHGESVEPVFKPDFNLDLMRCHPYTGRQLVFRRETFIGLGGFDVAQGELAPHDLLWRVVEAHGMASVGHVAELLVETQEPLATWLSRHEVITGNPVVTRSHLNRLGVAHRIVQGITPLLNRVKYLHEGQPLVSIVVSGTDQTLSLQRCVTSVLEKTLYTEYELLVVDNGSEGEEARGWFDAMTGLSGGKLTILRNETVLPPSALDNLVAMHAQGEYLLFIDPAVEVIDGEWLDEMLHHARRDEVGVVGAKLIDPDRNIAHAGLVLGLRGPMGSPFQGESLYAKGYMQRLIADQNYSAVSRDCLMVSKALFVELDGFDQERFETAFDDLDLCLRARQAGKLVVWTPYALLTRHASEVSGAARQASAAGRAEADQDRLYHTWLGALLRDPAYNHNLSLKGTSFSLNPGVRHGWQPFHRHVRPQVLAMPMNKTAVGHYRVSQPFLEMQANGLIGGRIAYEDLTVIDVQRINPDTLVLQGRYSGKPVAEIRQLQRYTNALRIYELDDYIIDVPAGNGHLRNIPAEVERTLREGISMCDRVVVSTEPLAYALRDMYDDIRVAPNMLAPYLWKDLMPQRRTAPRPRVGWGGGTSHAGDLALIVDVVKALANEVDWVFFGMCLDEIRPFIKEFHPVVELDAYPRMMAGLNLDLALAPLEQHIFNECKSNLRLLEYGACGYPVVCSDIAPYQGALPATRVRGHATHDWIDAIRMHLAEPDASYRMGDELRAAVHRDFMLRGDNLQHWYRAWMPD